MNNILIVDDDHVVRGAIREKLSMEGFEMNEAVDGQSALKKFKLRPPGVVILGQKLPDINGLEVLRQFRAVDPGVPVIMLTAFADVPESVLPFAFSVSTSDSRSLSSDDPSIAFLSSVTWICMFYGNGVDEGSWSCDNTYEIVEFEAPVTGTYTLEINKFRWLAQQASTHLGVAWYNY